MRRGSALASIDMAGTADSKAGQVDSGTVGEKISSLVRLMSLDVRRKSGVYEHIKR